MIHPSDERVPVAIVGAGPVGLALALGLARQGVRSVAVERKPHTSEQSKAPGIHVRTREVFRQWGVEERFLGVGLLTEALTLFAAGPGARPLAAVDFGELADEADRPGLLILEQAETERLLCEAARATGLCDVRFGTEAVGLAQDGRAASLTLRAAGTGSTVRADYVVGCDGAGSFVRDALALPFEGMTYSVRPMLADVRVEDARDALPWPRVYNSRGGLTVGIRLRPGLWRLIRLERGEPSGGEAVGGAEVRDRMREVLGDGPCQLLWASRFRIHRRAAPRFRVGRVLLAGERGAHAQPGRRLGDERRDPGRAQPRVEAGVRAARRRRGPAARLVRGGAPSGGRGERLPLHRHHHPALPAGAGRRAPGGVCALPPGRPQPLPAPHEPAAHPCRPLSSLT